jgi:general L-amino acid transport system ATP-binding protein
MTADENSGSLLKPGRLRTETAVELIQLNKWYGDFHVLRDINL